jgi:hypothetical protein
LDSSGKLRDTLSMKKDSAVRKWLNTLKLQRPCSVEVSRVEAALAQKQVGPQNQFADEVKVSILRGIADLRLPRTGSL